MEHARHQFEHLYDTYVDAIFHYLAFRLGDRERAKELTHEVFIRVWGHLSAHKPIEYEKAFLYTIAKRLFINEIRAPDNTFSLDAMTETGHADIPDVHTSVVNDAQVEELWRHVATLPPATQELLRLRYQDGLAVQDIAQILESKENTVSMRLARATEQLKTLYHTETP